ncbi:uncharacterized protein BDR25DRAFT_103436 [Lindgomyces ingoldianus]|uniref:Uncharacterized protein n=1 Tax=Lindgomyces ingoldianus TaxID=673940 RepID=A0ACB6R9W1_9PLEO|nr:uncharacterized protein BDR25DRAFT_103436 [Lindgomyces ingoldianus]KAF2475525.1 hypothetical protein BDR25DRAFT_103436 [Lindgomyces ingoldianus]
MQFAVESWIWYTFAVSVVFIRLISRSLLFGSLMRLQYDDWIMGIFVTGCYTVLIVMANIEAKSQSNLLPPGFDVSTLTSEEISAREYGSKIVIVVEQMQIAVIWACKACLLILYHRLTRMVASKENVAIKLLSAYVALGFVVMEILYFAAWCRPFWQYWAVPTGSSQCNALIDHRITNAVFNISSDLIMLCIALPMFIRSLLPLKRKLILCCIFSLGVFVILASVLNKYYSFAKPYEPTWIFWYARESSTAIIVANLPFTWTLLRKIFNLGAFDEHHPPPPTYHSSRTAGGRRTQRGRSGHGSGGGSAEKQPHSHGSNQSSKDSHSMSLIGSICAAKDPKATAPISDDSQHSENGLLHAQITAQDFGNVDLELGDRPSALGPRPLSPVASRATSARPSLDGSVHHYPSLASPRKAHLAPSRASSVASVDRRVLRPLSPSRSSHDGTGIGAPVGTGGGRSARDRKMRARLSN